MKTIPMTALWLRCAMLTFVQYSLLIYFFWGNLLIYYCCDSYWITITGIPKYRWSSISRKENGCSEEWQACYSKFSCRNFTSSLLCESRSAVNWYASFDQVYVGKERETVAEMLPYLRLGYISDADEIQSILSSEGDTCPVSHFTPFSEIVLLFLKILRFINLVWCY